MGGQLFFSRLSGGLTNRPPVRFIDAGAPLFSMMMFAYSTLAGIFLISSVKCTLLGTVSIILVKSEVQVLAKVSSEFRLDKKNWG